MVSVESQETPSKHPPLELSLISQPNLVILELNPLNFNFSICLVHSINRSTRWMKGEESDVLIVMGSLVHHYHLFMSVTLGQGKGTEIPLRNLRSMMILELLSDIESAPTVRSQRSGMTMTSMGKLGLKDDLEEMSKSWALATWPPNRMAFTPRWPDSSWPRYKSITHTRG